MNWAKSDNSPKKSSEWNSFLINSVKHAKESISAINVYYDFLRFITTFQTNHTQKFHSCSILSFFNSFLKQSPYVTSNPTQNKLKDQKEDKTHFFPLREKRNNNNNKYCVCLLIFLLGSSFKSYTNAKKNTSLYSFLFMHPLHHSLIPASF